MSEELYELCENLKKEIKLLNMKSDISPAELERLYKAVDIIKDIKTIEAMEHSDGYSNMSPYYEDGMDHYRSNNSYARGRDGMTGRYVSRDEGPMKQDEKQRLLRQIEEMKAKLDRM